MTETAPPLRLIEGDHTRALGLTAALQAADRAPASISCRDLPG